MIKELRLHNWKSFENATAYVDPLCFIIGTNASGKSNLFDAFHFLKLSANGATISEIAKEIRGGAEWMPLYGKDSFTLSVTVDGETESEEIDYSITYTKDSESKELEISNEVLSYRTSKNQRKLFYTNQEKLERGSAVIPTKFFTDARGRDKTLSCKRMVSVLSQIEGQNVQRIIKQKALVVKSQLMRIFILDPSPVKMRAYCPLDSQLSMDASNLAGVIASRPEQEKQRIERLITDYVKPLPEKDIVRVWTEKVGLFATDAMLYCEEKWSEDHPMQIDARGMSDGTLRFIAIVASLLSLPENGLLLLEEVDNGLHPSRTVELIRCLKELGSQYHIDILCTTHNPVLVDALGVEMLPFISYTKRDAASGTSTVLLLEDKDNLSKLLANNSFGYMMINDKL